MKTPLFKGYSVKLVEVEVKFLFLMSDSRNLEDDPAIGDQMEGTRIVYLANDMYGLPCGICRDMDGGYRLVSLVDGHFRCVDLRLLPPAERQVIAVRVRRGGGIESEGEDSHSP